MKTLNQRSLGRSPKFLFLLTFLLFFISISAQGKGTLKGLIIDSEFGEGLIGANVLIVGTTIGAATDIEGKYEIKGIPAGTYSLQFSSVGFAKKTVTKVEIKNNEITKIDVTLSTEAFETQEVVVTAKALQNTEGALLAKRQKSIVVSDAISAEAISRSGSGNAADAMKKVTGASVVGGKYVYVRGLGDRYSSTQLNGAELPSADPDKKSFNLDLLPSSLLDNLTTIKSFTPDKPGSFTGGLVDVSTKNYPDKFTLNFSISSSYNDNVSLSDDYITYNGGGKDWLGYDDGGRSLPDFFNDPDLEIPSPLRARRNRDLALKLDQYSRAFSNEVEPINKKAPVNQSYSFSIGDQVELMGRPFGYTASLSYSRKYSFYNDGNIGKWQLTGNYDDVDELNNYMYLNDSKGSEEVLIGGLFNIAYKPTNYSDISFRYLYTQSGESTTRFQDGSWRDQLGDDGVYETRSLLYTERNLQSMQLSGEHLIQALGDLKFKWTGAYSKTIQDEPDLRFFSNDYFYQNDEKIYNISATSYNVPTRFFRKLNEENINVKGDFSLPFNQWDGLSAKIKFGGSYTDINRDFRERRFEFRTSTGEYDGSPTDYFDDVVGLVDSTNGRYLFGSYIFDASMDRNNYDGYQKIAAAYAMIELPITKDLKFVGGARFETTEMNVTSLDTNEVQGNLDNQDILPSLNLIGSLSENMNVRASYGKTLARPSLRELAPFRSFEFLGDFLFMGNPDIKRTLIDNIDLRWEYFPRPGELFAVSLFYKKFDSPIERAFDPSSKLVSYKNVDEGLTYGAEFEFRSKLDFIHNSLENFFVNVNFSLVHSEVNIPEEEYNNLIKPFDDDAEDTRPLFGQSPYLVNTELSYLNYETGTSLSVFYNIFGERLSEVTLGITPDVYEQPKGLLDVTFSQKLYDVIKFKVSAKNLLDAKTEKTIELKGREYIYSSYSTGRSFSVGLSYSL